MSTLNLITNVTSGLINWPSCAQCQKVVTAYGKDAETDKYIDVFAEHHGARDGVRILKGPFFTQNGFGHTMRQLAFFSTSVLGTGSRVVKVGFVREPFVLMGAPK